MLSFELCKLLQYSGLNNFAGSEKIYYILYVISDAEFSSLMAKRCS